MLSFLKQFVHFVDTDLTSLCFAVMLKCSQNIASIKVMQIIVKNEKDRYEHS